MVIYGWILTSNFEMYFGDCQGQKIDIFRKSGMSGGSEGKKWREKIVLGKSQKREVKLFTNCEKVYHLRKKKVEHLWTRMNMYEYLWNKDEHWWTKKDISPWKINLQTYIPLNFVNLFKEMISLPNKRRKWTRYITSNSLEKHIYKTWKIIIRKTRKKCKRKDESKWQNERTKTLMFCMGSSVN